MGETLRFRKENVQAVPWSPMGWRGAGVRRASGVASSVLHFTLTMCRLLGIVSSEPTEFRLILQDAPRSLAALSREHRDGWGVAVFESQQASQTVADHGWRLRKAVACAAEDQDFRRLAAAPGEVVISHIRRRTVGAVSLENTHPFRNGRWVFAHNGTIHERDYLRSSSSARRLAEVRGHTDSELFFAYLLTELDAAGIGDAPASPDTDLVLRKLTRLVCANSAFGAVNFSPTAAPCMRTASAVRCSCSIEAPRTPCGSPAAAGMAPSS
jgi:predicted glutamine amidotransferase